MLSKCLKERIAPQHAQIGQMASLPFLTENANGILKDSDVCAGNL